MNLHRSSLAGLALLLLTGIVVVAMGISDPTDAGKKKKKRVPAMSRNTYIVAVKNTSGGMGPGVHRITVPCDPGDKILSGGFDELGASSKLRTNSPSDFDVGGDFPNEWIVAWNDDGSDDLVDVFALCSDFPPLHQAET